MPNNETWEEIYGRVKADFLVFDKQSGSRWLDDVFLKTFIRDQLTLARREERDSLKIGMLRQWLNEDRITDPKRIVTNGDIKHFLFFELSPTPITRNEEEK